MSKKESLPLDKNKFYHGFKCKEVHFDKNKIKSRNRINKFSKLSVINLKCY